MLNQISHDNVVRIFESYMSQRSLYIVLEYMAGGSLHDYIHRQEEKPFKDKLIINYAWQLCSALAHIHQLRIVHRDVSIKL
jgi:serine/threonine protein kinase